jgi:hypothetical protein
MHPFVCFVCLKGIKLDIHQIKHIARNNVKIAYYNDNPSNLLLMKS